MMQYNREAENKDESMVLPLSRDRIREKLLGQYQGQRVLVIGIGGGGDVVSTLPTCFDLEAIGATTIPAGLTWKRVVHDPFGKPRAIDEFVHVAQINSLIGEANPETRTKDGIVHIEAKISQSLGGRPVAMIDISPGTAALYDALRDYCTKASIDSIIGVDAGGDVLCMGHEPTLESPICDQTVLSALSKFEGSMLGVFGFGADGEMPLSALRPRFELLLNEGAYRGALPLTVDSIPRMIEILSEAPTESSRVPIMLAKEIAHERFDTLLNLLNASPPDLERAIGIPRGMPLRDGYRQADLSDLTATTMFFSAQQVFNTSTFAELWDDQMNIDQIHRLLSDANINTEFTERERLARVGNR